MLNLIEQLVGEKRSDILCIYGIDVGIDLKMQPVKLDPTSFFRGIDGVLL